MVVVTLCYAVLCLGCDDSPPAQAPAETKAKAAEAVGSAAPKPSEVAAPAVKEEKAAEATQLTDDDFTESLDKNRDPFRSYLTEFAQPQQRLVTIQRKGLLSRYSLDELRLIAVVSGRVRPRAMFLDPSGLGVAVRRGDYIGKSFGKVKEILTDKVIIEIQEISENRQRVADRVIELHPEQAVGKVDDGNGALR